MGLDAVRAAVRDVVGVDAAVVRIPMNRVRVVPVAARQRTRLKVDSLTVGEVYLEAVTGGPLGAGGRQSQYRWRQWS
jgi:hypothetical protein